MIYSNDYVLQYEQEITIIEKQIAATKNSQQKMSKQQFIDYMLLAQEKKKLVS